jgi:hypothetical protein
MLLSSGPLGRLRGAGRAVTTGGHMVARLGLTSEAPGRRKDRPIAKEVEMGSYVLAYGGGSMPETEAEQAQVMQAWTDWYGGLGAAVTEPR